jgi:peptidoglycan hydrolase-like protein with peptidoglycan-binding domain
MYTTALSHTYRANVVVIQLALRDRNYSPLAVDGYYGTQTRNAVKRYQRNHHLVVDGKVGLQTWRSLFGLGAA